jgi:serine phosphatase RsbU (regulator of sigma subunit)
MTAICLTVDPPTRRLRVASAGHHPAVKLDSATELSGERTGAALGLVAEIGCDSTEITLGGGEGVLLFTDGVIEARGRTPALAPSGFTRRSARSPVTLPTRSSQPLRPISTSSSRAGQATTSPCSRCASIDARAAGSYAPLPRHVVRVSGTEVPGIPMPRGFAPR